MDFVSEENLLAGIYVSKIPTQMNISRLFLSLVYNHLLLHLGMQMEKSKGPPLLPQLQLNRLIKKTQDGEVRLIVLNLARALGPAHPAIAIMPQRGGGTDAEADPDPHVVPDTPAGAWQGTAGT